MLYIAQVFEWIARNFIRIHTLRCCYWLHVRKGICLLKVMLLELQFFLLLRDSPALSGFIK